MCGISGIVSLKKSLRENSIDRLKNSLIAQKHRGPDDLSFWNNDYVALGHNRLSILDLSDSANQPFHRSDLDLTIVFNGEIYNYRELKEELLKKGFSFNTDSDTEVLLVSYYIYRENICEKLVGMFSFVIYDHSNNSIFMSRDRMGEKPLFYIHNDQEILFSSELNALRKLYDKDLTINKYAVIDLFENLYINDFHSIYNEVKVFPKAHFLIIQNGDFSWKEYYKLPFEYDYSPDFSELKLEVKEVLMDAIGNQLNADVPVATFLSSGIDSTVISAISKELKPDILAITMSSGNILSDESEDAKRVAKKLGINHEIVSLNHSSLACLIKIFRNIQPLADSSIIPTFLVTEAVSSKFKVMLSGDGGDEVFGSYNKPNLFLKHEKKVVLGGDLVINSLYDFKYFLADKYLSDKNRFILNGWEGFYRKNNLSGLYKKVFNNGKSINSVFSIAKDLIKVNSKDLSKISFLVDFETRLPCDFLFKVDSASMANSLEVRAPFLDHRLVDLAMRSKLTSLMPNGKDKELLRELYKEFVGEEYVGIKKGFSFTYSDFLKGSWGDLLEGFLKEGLSATYFNFNVNGLLELLFELRKSSNQGFAKILYTALVLEIWLRVFHLEQEIDLTGFN
jgi:asparagine synthase (glutamine-hydrolysing)